MLIVWLGSSLPVGSGHSVFIVGDQVSVSVVFAAGLSAGLIVTTEVALCCGFAAAGESCFVAVLSSTVVMSVVSSPPSQVRAPSIPTRIKSPVNNIGRMDRLLPDVAGFAIT